MESSQKPTRLHLGCGHKNIPGFYNIDLTAAGHIHRRENVKDLSFISENSVELIYCSHVLEHFGRKEIEEVLAEWHRVLTEGGKLRLAVPDFEACVKVYKEHGLDEEGMSLLGLLYGGQTDDLDFHKMVFDRKLLTRYLMGAGFTSVEEWDWRKTEHSKYDDYSQAYLPYMEKETGELMSLNLEATK